MRHELVGPRSVPKGSGRDQTAGDPWGLGQSSVSFSSTDGGRGRKKGSCKMMDPRAMREPYRELSVTMKIPSRIEQGAGRKGEGPEKGKNSASERSDRRTGETGAANGMRKKKQSYWLT